MKASQITLVFFFTIAFLSGFSQVKEDEKIMSKGLQTSVSAELLDTDEKFAVKRWREFIKGYARKTKENRKENEWFSDNASIVSINPSTPIDVYARFENSGDKVKTTIWFDLGTGFVNSTEYPREFKAAEQFVSDFQIFVKEGMIELEIAGEEKVLSKLETDMKKLRRDHEGYQKEIEKAKQTIIKNEENTVVNLKEQEEKTMDIQSQMNKIEAARMRLQNVRKKN